MIVTCLFALSSRDMSAHFVWWNDHYHNQPRLPLFLVYLSYSLPFYITSTPFPSSLSLSPTNLTIYFFCAPRPPTNSFFVPYHAYKWRFWFLSPPTNSLSLFMCVCDVGSIFLFLCHRIFTQISLFCCPFKNFLLNVTGFLLCVIYAIRNNGTLNLSDVIFFQELM